MTNTRVRSWLANVAVLLATVSLGLAGIEVFLGRYHPVAAAAYRTDDRLLYELIPGSRRLFRPEPANGGPVLVRVDDRGYRGTGVSQSKRGPRVVVFGDSFVEAEFSPLEQTFVARLGDELRQVTGLANLETINAGVAGYGPDQAALRMERDVEPLAPDLVVFCVFSGNDFGDLVRNRLFRLGNDGELVDNHPVLGDELQKSFDDARLQGRRPALVRTAEAAWSQWNAPPPKTSFPHYIDESLEKRRTEYSDFVERGSNVVENLLWDGYDADIALEPRSPSARFKASLMSGLLARVRHTAKTHGVPLLLVVIPEVIDVGAAYEIQVDRARYPEYDPRRLTGLLVGAADRLSIPCVDLYEPLTEVNGERFYFRYGDNHWNSNGQAKAAMVVARSIATMGLHWPSPVMTASR